MCTDGKKFSVKTGVCAISVSLFVCYVTLFISCSSVRPREAVLSPEQRARQQLARYKQNLSDQNWRREKKIQSFPFCKKNGAFKQKVDEILKDTVLQDLVRQERFSFSVRIERRGRCVLQAGVNQNVMMYAASIPKVIILFAFLKKVQEGALPLTYPVLLEANRMIRYSSNTAATVLYNLTGPEYIADVSTDSRYGFYDITGGGGFWMGKPFSKKKHYSREPLAGLSHAATTHQMLRFLRLLSTGKLLQKPELEVMKDILLDSALNHKLYHVFKAIYPNERIYRKSGGWGYYQGDMLLIEKGRSRLFVAGLINSPGGAQKLEQFAQKLAGSLKDYF